VANIAAELLRQRAWLLPELRAKGWDVLEADAPAANASGILTLHRAGADHGAIHARLAAAGVVTSLRTDRAGRQFIRLSPHCYNTDAELRRAVELL
jgi:selenocysteine lyase/cysteine desulfurase